MKAGLIMIILVIVLAGFLTFKMTGNTTETNPKVKLETSQGDIIVELYPREAPITTANFLRYVDEMHYEGTIFHRVIEGFMIQGGGYIPDEAEKPTHAPIKLESNNGLKNDIYTIAMARTSVPDSATAQFFINSVDNDFLNYAPGNPGYAVFGRVIEGTSVVDSISKVQTDASYKPLEDIKIVKVTIIG